VNIKRIPPFVLFKNIVAWLLSIIMLVPLALIVMTAFKSGQDAVTLSFALPKQWDASNLTTVIERGRLYRGFLNSFLYAGAGTVMTVMLASMASYMFSRRRTRGSQILYFFLVLGIVLPTNYVALMKVMQVLHLINQRIGIIFLYTATQIPFMVFLIYGFVSRIPISLDEAAVMDGCGPLRLFFSVIFPLLKPVFISAGVLCFLNMWNEFILPLYFLNATDKWPMTLAVYNFFGQFGRQWNLICANVLLTILPVIIVYLLCQKHIVGGLTAGAVKG